MSVGTAARNAAKWSLLSEMIAKIITPVTQLVLARILAPEAFGVLATVIMVASFGQMLADAGFSKYLVQHDFKSQRSLYRAADVTFWSSMTAALILMVLVVVGKDYLAIVVGTPGLGVPIAVASLSIPLSVFVSTQQALFRRAFEYKKLLPIRIVVAAVPLLISVPLAIAGLDYWSLIIGTLAAALINAIALTVVSPWKPRVYYSWSLLREMFSFSAWSLLEAISIWMTLWSGTFIVGSVLTPSELGLYRQPILVVNSLFAIVTGATTPILFAALSRLQNDRTEYRRFFLEFQFTVSVLLLPVGVGAFLYRDFVVGVLFGDQWQGASLMFGLWALTSGFNIVFAHYCSEVFRSLGRPRVSLLSQCLYMAVMIPALYFAAIHSFSTLVVVNALVRVVGVAISQSLMFMVAGIGFIRILKNLGIPLIASVTMGGLGWWLSALAAGEWLWCILGIIGCAIVYGGICLIFPRTRELLFGALSNLSGHHASSLKIISKGFQK